MSGMQISSSRARMPSIRPKMSSSESLARSALNAGGWDTRIRGWDAQGPREIAIYGFSHCQGGKIKIILSLAHLTDSSGRKQRAFTKILDYNSPSQIIPNTGPASGMKAFLTSTLFENYKRKKEGKKLVPVLFCGDIFNNPFPSTPEKITSKFSGYNGFFSHKEIRRILKHFILKEMLLDTPIEGLDREKALEIAKELVEIASETFIAVKVLTDIDDLITGVETIPFFFQDKSYPSLLEKRRFSSSKTGKKSNHWKKQLYTL